MSLEERVHEALLRFFWAMSPVPPLARMLCWLNLPTGQYWCAWTLSLAQRQAEEWTNSPMWEPDEEDR